MVTNKLGQVTVIDKMEQNSHMRNFSIAFQFDKSHRRKRRHTLLIIVVEGQL